MKKRIISNIVPILFTILVIYTISLLWNKITLPFENPEEVIGHYSKNNVFARGYIRDFTVGM